MCKVAKDLDDEVNRQQRLEVLEALSEKVSERPSKIQHFPPSPTFQFDARIWIKFCCC